jgi:hypothetical protein
VVPECGIGPSIHARVNQRFLLANGIWRDQEQTKAIEPNSAVEVVKPLLFRAAGSTNEGENTWLAAMGFGLTNGQNVLA